MLGREERQGSLFSTGSLLDHLFEADSFYSKLARLGRALIRDEDLAHLYHPTRGRPSIPPAQMLKAVLLALYDGCSDREAARRTAKDLDWKHALRLPLEHPGIHATTFCVFRARLLLHEADRGVFEQALQRAVEVGLFPRRTLQLVDSSPILGAAAVQDTYRLLQGGIRQLARAAGLRRLPAGLRRQVRRYLQAGKPPLDWEDAEARRAELGQLVSTAEALLQATVDQPQLAEARELLERLVAQDVEREPADGGGPAMRQGVAPERIVSVVDPEQRHGRKSRAQPFAGYKLHVVEEPGSEVITAVEVGPASEWDGRRAAGLVRQAAQAGAPVKELVGDTAYGDGATRVAVAGAGAEGVAKVPPPPATGRFTRPAFQVSPDQRQATCPAGVTIRPQKRCRHAPDRPQTVRFVFPRQACVSCELRSRCTTARGRRILTLGPHDGILQAARAAQAQPRVRRKLRRRAIIERKIAELKAHGLRRARYWGSRKVLLQARLTALLVNLKRLFTLGVLERTPQLRPV